MVSDGSGEGDLVQITQQARRAELHAFIATCDETQMRLMLSVMAALKTQKAVALGEEVTEEQYKAQVLSTLGNMGHWPKDKREPSLKVPEGCIGIVAPMAGIVYNAPSPEKELYTAVGKLVNSGDTILLIEAMKLFDEVVSSETGEVVAICENMTMVEAGTVIAVIRPIPQ